MGTCFSAKAKKSVRNQFARTTEELESYVGLYMKAFPQDMKKMIKEMTDFDIKSPKDHSDTASKTEVRLW
jgi:thioredoxin reductase